MSLVPYDDAAVPVRDDIRSFHRRLLGHVASPGTWWTAEERVAIAEAARAARNCRLCAERKAAISPFAVDGEHDGPSDLDPLVVDTVHRIVTDPGRLAKSWYDRIVAADVLDPDRYVELVSVAVLVTALDGFGRSVGAAPIAIPGPVPGEPSRSRPSSARIEQAWVPQIPAGDEGGSDWASLYGDRVDVAQVERGLSLVPAEVEILTELAAIHYVPFEHATNPGYEEPGRAIGRLQTELVAARVSAINECFY